MATRRLHGQGDNMGATSASVASSRGPGKASVLLVEDDRQVRDLLVLLLRGRGYAVQQAASGAEAEALSRRFRPDILVADVDLRGSPSGPALYGRLRCRYPGLKVLFISGYPREHLMRFGMDPGASRLLVKPFTADSLASTVTEVLAQP